MSSLYLPAPPRSVLYLRAGCGLGPREQFNTISSTIDGNTVYGSDEELQSNLRTHSGGLLKTIPIFAEYDLQDMLPLKLEEPDDGCIRPCKSFAFHLNYNYVANLTILS